MIALNAVACRPEVLMKRGSKLIRYLANSEEDMFIILIRLLPREWRRRMLRKYEKEIEKVIKEIVSI